MKLCTLILGLTLTHCAFASQYICYSNDNRTVPEFHASIDQSTIVLSRNFKPFGTLGVVGYANKERVELDIIGEDNTVVGSLSVSESARPDRLTGEFRMKSFSKNKLFYISCMSQEAK